MLELPATETLSSVGSSPQSRDVERASLGARVEMSLPVPVSSLESSYCRGDKRKGVQCCGSCLGMLPAAASSAARQRWPSLNTPALQHKRGTQQGVSPH